MPSRRTAGLIVALTTLALVAGGLAYVYRDALGLGGTGEGEADRGRPPPLVETAQAELRPLESRVGATGTLIPPEAVTVTTEAAGRVAEIRFEEGDRVAKGEVLVVLERRRQEARVREAEARVLQARREAARRTELYEKDFVSAGEVERSGAAREEAEAALSVAREDLEDRTIQAPFAGVTGRRLVSPGALLQPGTAITRLTLVETLDLRFDVPERRIGRVLLGQTVKAASPAYPGETFTGEVTFVGTELEQATRTLPVEATLPNPGGRLKPGMFMSVDLIVGKRDALTVPEAAVVSRGPTQYVYRLRAGTVQESRGASGGGDTGGGPRVGRVPVETDVRRDGWVEIPLRPGGGRPSGGLGARVPARRHGRAHATGRAGAWRPPRGEPRQRR
jgi:membrane fusion protein (multidrug efflux system)